MATADVHQGEGVVAARVAVPSTPGANSEATANGRFGVDVAGNGRVSPVDVFQDALDMAVNRSVVSSHHDDDCFYYQSWRNNVVIAFGTLSSFVT